MSLTAQTVQLVVILDPFALGSREVSDIPAGMLADLVPDTLAGRDDVTAYYEGERIEPSDWATTDCDGGTLGFVVVPAGFAEAWLFIKYLAAAYLVGRIVTSIFGVRQRPPIERGDTNSSVYSFDGISNTRSEGLPLPLVFGRMRYGGTIINEYLRSQFVPEESILFQQISFGEGPVDSVGGVTEDSMLGSAPPSVKLNGNSADNYDGVQMWVRLGTNEQAVVPGFESTLSYLDAGFTMAAEETTSESNALPNSGYNSTQYADTTNDTIWDTYGVARDMTSSEVDAAIVRIFFDRGLFTQDISTGELLPSTYALQVRYRELTVGGVPITTGGYVGDGWVRLPPQLSSVKSPDPFHTEITVPLFDPQLWAPALVGKGLRYTAEATQSSSSVRSFTSMFWIKLGIVPSPVLPNWILRFGTHWADPTGTGVYLRITPLGAIEVRYADGPPAALLSGTMQSPNGVLSTTGIWRHIALVVDADGTFQSDQIRLYVDGALLAETVPGSVHIEQVIRAGETQIIGGPGLGTGFPALLPIHTYDQFVIYDEALNDSLIHDEFNDGEGRSTYLDAPYRAISAAKFEDSGGAQDPAAPGVQTFTAWTPVAAGGSTSGVEVGLVPISANPDNVRKRSRYRVEVLRTNQDSINDRTMDDMTFAGLLAVVDSELTYPNTPILAIKAGATEQLNGSVPTTTAIVKGLLVPVWDGASTVNPSISTKWSANPAWITLGLLTHGRWGLGQTYIIHDCVSQSLLDWANYCDELVYNGSVQFNYDTPTTTEEDVLFVKDTADPLDRGTITFNIRTSSAGASLPVDWVAGTFIRAHGFPVVGGGADINSGAIGTIDPGGYEIVSIEEVVGANNYWSIACHWDRLNETDPWTSGTYLGAAATITTAATLELGERRHEFNGVFDQEQGAWDAILEVCQVGRAVPIREGTKVRFKFQHPRSPVGLITSASIVDGTFEVAYSDGSMKPNAIDATIADRAQDYELVPITILDPAISNVLSLDEVRKVSRTYFGITSAAQAERQARFELNINRLIQRGGSFTLGPSGLPFEAGDLVRLGADIMPRGDGGRTLRASHPGTGYKIEMVAAPLDFTAWTASNVTVTANTVANPYGTATDADKVQDSGSSHGYVEATGTVSGSDLNAEWLSFGVYIKPGVISSNKSLVALILDGGTASYFCDWTTETIYASQFATLPEDMRSAHIQKLGTSGWYFVQVAGFHETKTSAAAAPIVRVFPASDTSGAGAATGIVEVFNGRMSYGQWAAPGGTLLSGRVVMIDRDITLADGAHKVYGRDYVDNAADGPLDSTLCPAGSYITGDILITSSTMGTALQEESSWLVVKSGDELVVEIISSSLGQDLTRECEWVEYNAAIYDDVAGMTSTSPLLGFTGDGDIPLGIDYSVDENSLPGRTSITGGTDILVRQAPGQFVTTIYLGLGYERSTMPFISRTEIFWRVAGANVSDWNLAGGATGLSSTAIVQLPNAQPGQTIELTAQSITQRGRRRKPGSSLRRQVILRGLTAPPETPTSVSAELNQREATYGYTVTGEDLLAVEIRRGGGWILGQLVSREAASQRAGTRSSEPTSNWAGSTTGSPTLLYAAQNAAGAYGIPAALTFNPTPDADRLPSDATRPDQAWESWDSGGNGWESAVPASGEPFIGPECEQATSGSLGFTAASTSVVWETVYTTQRDSGAVLTLEQDRQPRAAFLEAWVDAEAVNHTTWDAGLWEISDMMEDRWTWEGPRYTTPGETANPELVIEVRINIDGTTAGWGSWQEYKPGIYRIVDAQFRLRARRHDTGQNIIVAKLHTRITPPRLSLEETTPVQSMLHGESF